ncbi:MAG: ribosome biogenesis GTPase YlqF [Candidatus Izemoplasmatales bacterium]
MKQIQWFPGHMAKARRQVEEKLQMVDIVYELLDARIPYSSENPMMAEIIKDKPRLLILNKTDLADELETKNWIQYYSSIGLTAIAVSSTQGSPLKEVLSKSKELLKDLFEKETRRGLKSRSIRAMIIGIPNVGKSQFINRLAGKNKAKTGDKPGLTKTQVYLKAGDELELLDNPGILWPKFEDEKSAFHLALLGSIKEDILPLDEVCIYGLNFLIKNYPKRLKEKYKLDTLEHESIVEIIDQIGMNRGCIYKKGEIDYDRVYKLFLYDFRNMGFGYITIERAEKNV